MRKRTFLSIFLTVLFILLSNKFWLIFKTKTSAHFEFEIFTIILVLSFLFFYKITDYIADFKTIREKSRIDIIFLTIFFVFLFIPMSHVNQDEKSVNLCVVLERSFNHKELVPDHSELYRRNREYGACHIDLQIRNRLRNGEIGQC